MGGTTVPDKRPYTAGRVLGRDVTLEVLWPSAQCDEGYEWSLDFRAAGSDPSTATVIGSTGCPELSCREEATTDILWKTLAYTETLEAGRDPNSIDLFTLTLSSTEVASGEDFSDSVSVYIDNTPPIAIITALCRDAGGLDCYPSGLEDNGQGSLEGFGDYEIDAEQWPTLFVFGYAIDKYFDKYEFRYVGPGVSDLEHWCEVGGDNSSGCDGAWGYNAGKYGYGTTLDVNGKVTFDEEAMDPDRSDPALLLALDLTSLPSGAYAFYLVVTADVFNNDGKSQAFNDEWVTFDVEH